MDALPYVKPIIDTFPSTSPKLISLYAIITSTFRNKLMSLQQSTVLIGGAPWRPHALSICLFCQMGQPASLCQTVNLTCPSWRCFKWINFIEIEHGSSDRMSLAHSLYSFSLKACLQGFSLTSKNHSKLHCYPKYLCQIASGNVW